VRRSDVYKDEEDVFPVKGMMDTAVVCWIKGYVGEVVSAVKEEGIRIVQ